jgi:hypothetical protein
MKSYHIDITRDCRSDVPCPAIVCEPRPPQQHAGVPMLSSTPRNARPRFGPVGNEAHGASLVESGGRLRQQARYLYGNPAQVQPAGYGGVGATYRRRAAAACKSH